MSKKKSTPKKSVAKKSACCKGKFCCCSENPNFLVFLLAGAIVAIIFLFKFL